MKNTLFPAVLIILRVGSVKTQLIYCQS